MSAAEGGATPWWRQLSFLLSEVHGGMPRVKSRERFFIDPGPCCLVSSSAGYNSVSSRLVYFVLSTSPLLLHVTCTRFHAVHLLS